MESLSNKVIKNASWIIVIKIVQALLGLLINIFTARYLGPSNYGLISYAASMVAFVVPIMQLGLPGVLVQELVNHPDQESKIMGTSLGMSLISSLVCIIGLTAFVNVVNAREMDTIVVCILYSISLIPQAVETMQYWFQAKLKSKYVTISSFVAYVIFSGYKIFLLIAGKSIYWFALSYMLDYSVIAITQTGLYRKLSKSGLKFSFPWMKKLFSKSRFYIISNMMITVFAQTDRIMLKLMLDDAAAGCYSAAVSCTTITGFVFIAIIDSMRPLIYESKKNDKSLFEKNIARLYCIIIYLSLCQSVVVVFAAPLAVNVLYGEAYANAIDVLRVIIWYTTPSYIGAVRDIWLLAEDKQRYIWVLNLFGALFNVILNYLLIPAFGGVGAAIASLFTQIFTNVILSFFIRQIAYNNRLIAKGMNLSLLTDMVKWMAQKIRPKRIRN